MGKKAVPCCQKNALIYFWGNSLVTVLGTLGYHAVSFLISLVSERMRCIQITPGRVIIVEKDG